jgi:membrane protease YdiL (CAAX protease family)
VGRVLAISITSFLFGLAHISQGLPGLVDNIFMGAVMAILYFMSQRNLWLPILTHGIIDTIGFTLIFLGYFASPAG